MSKQLESLFNEAQLAFHNLPKQFRILSKLYGRFNRVWDINEFIAFKLQYQAQLSLAKQTDIEQLGQVKGRKRAFDRHLLIYKDQSDATSVLQDLDKLLQNLNLEINELEKLIFEYKIYSRENRNEQDQDFFLRELNRNEMAFRLNISMVHSLLKTLLECTSDAIQLDDKSTSDIEPKLLECLEALKSTSSRFEKCLSQYESDRDRLKRILSGQEEDDDFQSSASMTPQPSNTVSYNFMLKAGASLSGLVSVSSFALVILAINSTVMLTPIGLGAAVGVGVVSALTSYGLYRLSQSQHNHPLSCEEDVPDSYLDAFEYS